MTNKTRVTQAKQRLLSLFQSVEDKDTRTVIAEVVNIEAKNRSAVRFPLSDIRDVVESVARKSGE